MPCFGFPESLVKRISHLKAERVRFPTFDGRELHAYLLEPKEPPADASDRLVTIISFYGGRNGFSALSQILAAELEKSHIRVNCIDPGPTRTALRKRAFPGEDNAALKAPDALAPLYLWAIGPDSRGTTGQRLVWDD